MPILVISTEQAFHLQNVRRSVSAREIQSSGTANRFVEPKANAPPIKITFTKLQLATLSWESS